MGLHYVFIDESGDLGLLSSNSSKYLILAALVTDKPQDLDGIIKRMRTQTFCNELKGVRELKANRAPFRMKQHMLKELDQTNTKIIYAFADKREMTSSFLRRDAHKFYNFISGFLVYSICNHIGDRQAIKVVIDRSTQSVGLKSQFNHYFRNKVSTDKHKNKLVDIHHARSETYSGLQFADLVSWSCFQKHERNDLQYLNLIQSEIVAKQVFHAPRKSPLAPLVLEDVVEKIVTDGH